ncbi:MAG TPA: STAS/SEC14 domain-containing protein [Candidatus Acidoferrum sp.]|nr:STAS/SEC14 domain-containing protein [Candidatus Acidoferrum sp.]
MSVEIFGYADGILTVKVAGKLTQPEIARAQQQAIGIITRHGKIRLLIIAENFQGWEGAGNWDDVSFQAEYDQHIERMAIVGDKRWEDLTLIFVAKGYRGFAIEYFLPEDLPKARDWLVKGS